MAPGSRDRVRARSLLARTLRGVAAGVLGLVALVLAVLAAVTLTPPGRQWALEQVVTLVNPLLPGEIRASELVRVGPYGVELRDVQVIDPSGKVVARARHVAVGLSSVTALFRGHLNFGFARVRDGYVDLGDFGDEHGLLAAVIPAESAEPAPENAGPGLRVSIADAGLSSTDLEMTIEGLGPFEARAIRVRGALAVDEHIRVSFSPLSARVRLADVMKKGASLRIERAEGRFVDAASDSRLALDGDFAGSALAVRFSGRSPTDPEFERSSLSAQATIKHLDGATLAAAGVAGLEEELRFPLDVTLGAQGPPNALDAEWTVAGRAGKLVGEGRLEDRRISAELRSSRLVLSKLLASAPAFTLGGVVKAHADLGDEGSVPLSLSVSDATLDGEPLPSVEAAALLDGERIEDIDVTVRGYGGTITSRGRLDMAVPRGELTLELNVPDLRRLPGALRKQAPPEARHAGGALAGEVRGRFDDRHVDGRIGLSLHGLQTRALSATDLQLTAVVSGAVSAPQVDLRMRGWKLRASDHTLDRAELYVRGGPESYRFASQALTSGVQLSVRGDVRRLRGGVALSTDVAGKLHGHELQATLTAPYLGFDGRLGSRGACADAYGAAVNPPPEEGAVLIKATGLDLAAVSDMPGVELDLAGMVDVDATLCGTVADTRAFADVTLHKVRLPDRPAIDGRITASLSADQGRAAIETLLRSGDELDASLFAVGTFPTRGPGAWPERLIEADVEGRAVLREVPTEFLDRFLSEPLPVRGVLEGEANLEGSLDEHKLKLALRGAVSERPKDTDNTATPPDRTRLTLQFNYDRDEAQVSLSAGDGLGPLLDLQVAIDAPGPSLLTAISREAQLAHLAAYRMEAKLEPRLLSQIPVELSLPQDFDNVRYGLAVTMHHAPEVEPELSADLTLSLPAGEVEARELEGAALGEYECAADAAEVRAHLDLKAAQLKLTAEVDHGGRETLSAAARSRLSLIPTLMSGTAPSLEEDAFEVLLKETTLSSLPFVCRWGRGRIAGKVEGKRLLSTEAPVVHADVQAEELRLSGSNGLSVRVKAELRPDEAKAKVALSRGDARSQIDARVPLEWVDDAVQIDRDQNLHVDARLDRLPLSPLFPVDGPVSQVRGTLSGAATLSGTLRAPRLRGELTPKDASLTITPIAQPLRRVEGHLSFTEDFLEVKGLRAFDGDGSLQVDGTARLRLDDQDKPTLATDLNVKADAFPLRSQGQVSGEVDAKVHVRGNVSGNTTRLHVTLEEASAWLVGGEARSGISLDPHPDVDDPRASRSLLPSEEVEDSEVLALRLDTDQPFWVQRDDFAVRVSADLQVKVEKGEVAITGPIKLRRGYLVLLGATFELDPDSKLVFIGTAEPDPALSIKATTINRRSGAEVTVTIAGRASNPELSFQVDGQDSSAGDVATALFGRSGAQASSETSAADDARSFVAGVVASLMAVSARRELGDLVPLLMIEPRTASQSTRVRAGFELDRIVPHFMEDVIRGVYLEGVFSGSEGQSSGVQGGVLLELYLPADLVTSGQYGPGETFSLDLGWEP